MTETRPIALTLEEAEMTLEALASLMTVAWLTARQDETARDACRKIRAAFPESNAG